MRHCLEVQKRAKAAPDSLQHEIDGHLDEQGRLGQLTVALDALCLGVLEEGAGGLLAGRLELGVGAQVEAVLHLAVAEGLVVGRAGSTHSQSGTPRAMVSTAQKSPHLS